jgi:hypothetical protein
VRFATNYTDPETYSYIAVMRFYSREESHTTSLVLICEVIQNPSSRLVVFSYPQEETWIVSHLNKTDEGRTEVKNFDKKRLIAQQAFNENETCPFRLRLKFNKDNDDGSLLYKWSKQSVSFTNPITKSAMSEENALRFVPDLVAK